MGQALGEHSVAEDHDAVPWERWPRGSQSSETDQAVAPLRGPGVGAGDRGPTQEVGFRSGQLPPFIWATF